LTVMVGPVGSFDPESAETLFKPESSAALDIAGKTAAAESFLRVARFPKATVETTAAGTRVDIRDLLYEAIGETNREVFAVIHLDAANHVVAQELVWASTVAQQ
jgi:DNA repair protein RadC